MEYTQFIKSLSLDSFNADFIDARIELRKYTAISLENHTVNNAIQEEYSGIFIRMMRGGKWYYTALNELDRDKIVRSIEELIDFSGSHSSSAEGFYTSLEPSENRKLMYGDNLLNAPVNDKMDMIRSYDGIMNSHSEIVFSSSMYVDRYSVIYYGDSAGRTCVYDYAGGQVGLTFMMNEGNERFMGTYKKYSDNFDELSGLDNDIEGEIKESRLFISAPTARSGVLPVVLSPDAAGVFAHESFGHKSEADFMIGDKKMKEEWKIGKKVGSDILSIIDDGSIEHTSGYTPFDDEGMPACKTYLVKNGVLTERLHSLSTAYELGEKPTGNGRAINTEYEPIVRMTSTYIDKGESSFDQLISGIDDGYYIKTIKHGSGMSTFTIAPHKSYRIRNGKLEEAVKINVITGTVFETLNLIDGLSDNVRIKSSLSGGCGKMEQFPLRVSFGGPEVRISRMNIS